MKEFCVERKMVLGDLNTLNFGQDFQNIFFLEMLQKNESRPKLFIQYRMNVTKPKNGQKYIEKCSLCNGKGFRQCSSLTEYNVDDSVYYCFLPSSMTTDEYRIDCVRCFGCGYTGVDSTLYPLVGVIKKRVITVSVPGQHSVVFPREWENKFTFASKPTDEYWLYLGEEFYDVDVVRKSAVHEDNENARLTEVNVYGLKNPLDWYITKDTRKVLNLKNIEDHFVFSAEYLPFRTKSDSFYTREKYIIIPKSALEKLDASDYKDSTQ